jgi:uncharacterized membrane protein required for colicin V production
MNMLDLVVFFLLAVGLVRGAWVGARSQLISAAAWMAGIVAAWFAAGPLALSVEGALAVPYGVAWAVSGLVVANVTGFLTKLGLEFLLGDSGGKTTPLDRALGAVWGGAKWSLLLWLLLSSLALFDAALRGLKVPVDGSRTYAAARDRNVWRMAFGRRIEKLEQAVRKLSPEAEETPVGAVVEEVRTDPRFAALSRGGIMEALSKGDLRALLHSDDALSLLSDSDFLEKVDAILIPPAAGE